MAQKLDDSEIASFKELLMANSIQVDALAQLMIRKGFRKSLYGFAICNSQLGKSSIHEDILDTPCVFSYKHII